VWSTGTAFSYTVVGNGYQIYYLSIERISDLIDIITNMMNLNRIVLTIILQFVFQFSFCQESNSKTNNSKYNHEGYVVTNDFSKIEGTLKITPENLALQRVVLLKEDGGKLKFKSKDIIEFGWSERKFIVIDDLFYEMIYIGSSCKLLQKINLDLIPTMKVNSNEEHEFKDKLSIKTEGSTNPPIKDHHITTFERYDETIQYILLPFSDSPIQLKSENLKEQLIKLLKSCSTFIEKLKGESSIDLDQIIEITQEFDKCISSESP
jgi:hypothetical protein